MSGGHGSGGYPGQGYEGDPGRARQRRGGGQHWDEGRDPRGYAGQEYGGPGYGGYDQQGYDQQGYDQQGTGGYYPPGQYGGTGGMPQQYDQRRPAGPRRPQGGYDQRGNDPRQRGYNDRDGGEGDSSFLPGFGGRDDRDDRYPQERGGRYGDYDDRRAGHGDRPDGRGAGGRGSGGRGPDPRAWDDEQGGYGEDRRPGRGDDRDDSDRKPRKKATRWLPRILVLTVVAAIVAGGLTGGLYVYHKYEARYHPPDYAGPGTGDVLVPVQNGDTAFSLAPKLVQLGVVASTRAFENAAEATPNTTTSLKVGYYQLHYHMQASLAYAALLNPKNLVQTTVTIPEGKRVSQVLTILAARTKIPLSQFETAAKDTAALGLPSYAGTSVKLPATVPYGQLEGYLFPATYAITPHETAMQILQAMVQRFDIEAQQVNIQQAAKSAGLTPGELIIEASMVQAEAGLNSDMPKMASVINNRKAAGMPDGFDSVVFYGLGRYGINIPNNLDPATAGLYDNTQKPGLPPTPIDNPGDAAIQAVLHPAKTNYLYFLTVATGKPTEFSSNCNNLPGTC
ncbi:MAG TPA: endolytic transglycosylase MltG [Trebonia sp.]|nr:endolytic transglycosylase MltG [Trebonia sp.]